VGALIRKVPLKAKVAFMPCRRVRGNDGHEECTVVQLTPDLLIPRVPAAKLALVEPDLEARSSKSLADALCRIGILRGVAEEYSPGVRADAIQ